ncbi:serine/threonine protein kinase [Geodermatophilus telluris]|uniref:non-specific serine/threonine protein kinase n=1 Tax=Geodermatophilus telluris TaxID=1190417 RepID=A0A1G6UBN8_9ACTN|nr:serine/threonine-protein kinase [Geodermatophilus telluris]SDD38669.1 serine/threonine protein kinase [Geodermatophilus telluris]
MVEPGRRMLGDRYELSGLIASGGMGQVWRATDLLLHRPVAVKVLRSEYTGDPTFLARFRAEAQHAAALSHPNIATVYDYGETEAADTGEQLAYLVMELVEGPPLSTLLRQEGALDAGTTLSVLGQTAAALAEAHRAGLVHRDVKPGNILVRPDGSVKITDFGIAWSAGSVPLTQTGQVIGTPQYLSPEQAEGHLATPASDVYALGLVGYECLTGHPAFDGDNAITIALKQLRSDPEPLPDTLPGGVRTLIRRALAKDPAARMPDGAAFVAAVADARAGRLPADPPPPPAAPVPVAAVPTAVPTAAPAAAPDVDPGPATQATPAPTGGARHGGPPPPRRRAAAVLVPLIALLLGAGLAGVVFTAVSDGATPPPVVAAQTRDGEDGLVLVAGDYVGRPVDDVATQLSALGLGVERHQQVTGSAVPGLVVALSPTGVTLEPDDDVVVTYAVAPPSRDTGTWEREDRGEVSPVTGDSAPAPDAQPLPAAPETTAVTPTPEVPVTSSATPTGTPTPSPSPDPTATGTPVETTTPEAPTTTAGPTSATPSAPWGRPGSPSPTPAAGSSAP